MLASKQQTRNLSFTAWAYAYYCHHFPLTPVNKSSFWKTVQSKSE